MHLHLEGHRRHSAVRTGLGNQVIALRGLPVGVFGVASLETGTDQAAGLIAEGDIPRAEAIDLQQAGISVWYQTPHGHAEKLTGRWLIDPIEQCRSAARPPLKPEVKGLITAVSDKAEGDAHAGFGGDFVFCAGAETGQEIQRGRLQAGLFAAWLVVLCLLWGRRALQGAAEGIGNNQRPLIIKGAWSGLGDAHTRKTEVEVAYNFLRTFVRALRVSDFGVFPIPGFGKPVVDPFLAVVGHIVKTQRIGRQPAAYGNKFTTLAGLCLLVIEVRVLAVVGGEYPVLAAPVAPGKLPLGGGGQVQRQVGLGTQPLAVVLGFLPGDSGWLLNKESAFRFLIERCSFPGLGESLHDEWQVVGQKIGIEIPPGGLVLTHRIAGQGDFMGCVAFRRWRKVGPPYAILTDGTEVAHYKGAAFDKDQAIQCAAFELGEPVLQLMFADAGLFVLAAGQQTYTAQQQAG